MQETRFVLPSACAVAAPTSRCSRACRHPRNARGSPPCNVGDARRSGAGDGVAERARGGRWPSSPNPDCRPLWYEAALGPPAGCSHPSPSYPHPHKLQLAGDIFDTSSSLSAHHSSLYLAANSRVLGEGTICQSSLSKAPSY